MSHGELLDAALPVVEQFERLCVPYFVGGSVASSAYGFGRTTLDIDFIADLKASHVSEFAAALQAEYYVSTPRIEAAIRNQSCFNVLQLATMMKVDVFVAKNTSYDRAALGRIQKKAVTTDETAVELFLASPEDVILSKLRWYRLGDCVSDQQWRDVQEVLKVQAPTLEWDYLRHWAADLGLTDLFERAIDEAGVRP